MGESAFSSDFIVSPSGESTFSDDLAVSPMGESIFSSNLVVSPTGGSIFSLADIKKAAAEAMQTDCMCGSEGIGLLMILFLCGKCNGFCSIREA
jgi:hypothetical protein